VQHAAADAVARVVEQRCDLVRRALAPELLLDAGEDFVQEVGVVAPAGFERQLLVRGALIRVSCA